MPSEKVLREKQAIVAELAEKLSGSVAGVLVDYKGITVAEDTKLRKELREAGVEYSVLKNTLLLRACEKANLAELGSVLSGTTALAVSRENPVAAAKILSKFADASKGKFTVKAGYVDGKVIDAAGVKELATLPSREELVAKALGGLNAPISGFVCVLNANIRGLAVALNAIAEKKSA
ncbi:MAG TPA: 50S ribosomal protein L10 [Candidatus Fimivivens faecavium]|nr:50S ribosomal protein L10 [Candidatus Fimivivens faecavium]